MSEIMWKDNHPTRWGVEVFTRGDCWVLAYHLAKKLGLNVVHRIGSEGWGHICIKVDGRYFDVLGFRDTEDLVRTYDTFQLGTDTLDITNLTINQYAAHPDIGQVVSYIGDWSQSRRMADRLIEKYDLRVLTTA